MKHLAQVVTFVFLMAFGIFAQSGGVYQITQSVTGNGGGNASGGIYSLDGTAGQTVTEQSSQVPFQVKSGFWQPVLAPTAATVSIAGRVRTTDGRGLRNAIVVLTDSLGSIRTARTASFGYYRFDEIEVGQTVIVTVHSKLFQFTPQVISVNESLSNLDFVPIGEELDRL